MVGREKRNMPDPESCSEQLPEEEDAILTLPEPSINSGGEDTDPPRRTTRSQKLILVTFCLCNFGSGIFYSLLGPFFPLEAKGKGLDSTLIGLIFGIYELVFVIASPIFGKFLTKIGPNFMTVAGIFSFAYCVIIFGFLGASPPGITFTVLCFSVRCVEGLGAAALTTATLAITAETFPDKVTTMFGILETCAGLGLMVGPPIGGWLYQLGGFRLPFLASGSVLGLVGIITIFILPKSSNTKSEEQEGSLLTLLSSPLILLGGLLSICASGAIGFIDVGLSPVLYNQLGLSPLMNGVVFLIGPGIYAVMAPIWGIAADKSPNNSIWMLIVGYIFGGLSFLLLGPSPLIDLGMLQFWEVIVSQLVMGLGISTMVITFQLFATAAKNKGMPDTLGTYGLISGIFTSTFCFGAFLGPIGGGALIDALGFPWACTIVGFIITGSAILTAIYMTCERCCFKKSRTPEHSTAEERSPLLKENQQ